MRFFAPLALASLVVLSAGACSTYRDHLNRGERLYDENEYEKSLAIWRVLEADINSLSYNDQARYTYLRGMTDYRLGFRPDARHWLALSKATEQEHPGGLRPDWKKRIDEALHDLNGDVFGGAERFDQAPAAESSGGDAGAGAGSEASQTCQSDADCGADEACVSGACAKP